MLKINKFLGLVQWVPLKAMAGNECPELCLVKAFEKVMTEVKSSSEFPLFSYIAKTGLLTALSSNKFNYLLKTVLRSAIVRSKVFFCSFF